MADKAPEQETPDFLEPDDEFEGVGAHARNPRYDVVDE
jgi:hypothetical protein